jgi:hypothetical protein
METALEAGEAFVAEAVTAAIFDDGSRRSPQHSAIFECVGSLKEDDVQEH